jgi:hypothetical protein
MIARTEAFKKKRYYIRVGINVIRRTGKGGEL